MYFEEIQILEAFYSVRSYTKHIIYSENFVDSQLVDY